MNGIESIHITVFPILNTPGVICSAAERETETGQRLHFQQRNIWFFSLLLNIALPNPLPLLSIIYFQLNGGWRIPPFAQWNILKALLARQLKGHVYFFTCVFFIWSADSPHLCCGSVLTTYTSCLLSITQEQLHCCICCSTMGQPCSNDRATTVCDNGAPTFVQQAIKKRLIMV